MRIEALVSHSNQLTVEPSSFGSSLVTGNQQDCSSARIKSESNPPQSSPGVESKFFQIRMLRSLERIHMRSTERRPKQRQNPTLRQHLVLDLGRQCVELGLELVGELDSPTAAREYVTEAI
jgi:hypothetical protein